MVVGNFPIANKIAVVTGGGSGINLAFVKLALASNAKVLIADLKLTPEAQSLLSTTTSSNPTAPTTLAFTHCDVSSWSSLNALPTAVRSAFGPTATADIWIAGAGIFEPKWSSFLHDTEGDEESHYKTLSINAEHPIKLTRIAIRSLLAANKPGVVVLVASMAGVQGSYTAPLYCASKHAVVGFAKSMAQADGDEGVKVVCVCPGMVDTPLWTGEEAREVAEQHSFAREMCVDAEEVGRAMLEMIQEEKYPGGSLVEVSKTALRGHLESQVSFDTPAMKAWIEKGAAPIRAVFNEERKANL